MTVTRTRTAGRIGLYPFGLRVTKTVSWRTDAPPSAPSSKLLPNGSCSCVNMLDLPTHFRKDSASTVKPTFGFGGSQLLNAAELAQAKRGCRDGVADAVMWRNSRASLGGVGVEKIASRLVATLCACGFFFFVKSLEFFVQSMWLWAILLGIPVRGALDARRRIAAVSSSDFPLFKIYGRAPFVCLSLCVYARDFVAIFGVLGSIFLNFSSLALNF